MKKLSVGDHVTVKIYRSGKDVLHNLHGIVGKIYHLSALIIVDEKYFNSVTKLVGNDRIVVSFHEIAELNTPTIDLNDIKSAVINSWCEGLTTPEIASRVDKSIRTVYCMLKKLGLKPNRRGNNLQWIFGEDKNC